MKTSRNGFQQSYNAQMAVDAQHQIIVASYLDNSAADSGCLTPVVDQVEAITGKTPLVVLADAGYRSEANFNAFHRKRINRAQF